ncbi:hypothetical protein [Reinekea blandensis]|uniref:Uncharacterized protein n=1 Tax=Reinekea blandensis MED297 TaxID=314283 RepID=A4BK12_9GAMM|nr:hypothetical protein [Reinekea blandensis]EAR07545.1 hypothetical protein MED297_04734 [Reinekea sp. MED297] [Reinekea blandensis MED297]
MAILLIGGAPRTGKSLLAHQLMTLTNTPYQSIDPLKMAIHHAIPDYPLDTNAGSVAVSEQLWPFLKCLVQNSIDTGVSSILEGELLPARVAELMQANPGKIRACFVGYQSISITEKCQQIRRHSGHPNDWTADLDDTDLASLVKEGIQFSHQLRHDCHQQGLPYIDFSDDYERAAREVIRTLTATSQ